MTKVAGGKSIPLEAIRLKKEGVTAGVADVLVLSDIEPRIVALETKTEKGKQSTSQAWWQAEAEKAGVAYHIVRSVDDVMRLIETYGLKKQRNPLTTGLRKSPAGRGDPRPPKPLRTLGTIGQASPFI